MKDIFLFKLHRNLFVPSYREMCAKRATKLHHSISLFPTNVLLKLTLSGLELDTSATVACFLRTILNKFGYWSLKAWFPNHLSS